MLPGLGSRELGPPGRNPTFNSPLAARAKAPVIGDAIGAGCRYGEAASRFLELCLVGVGHRMCLWWLRSRELGPPARNPRHSLLRDSQCQGSVFEIFLS